MAKKNSTKAFTDFSTIKMTPINATLLIRDIIEGYVDNSENDIGGISSMNGRLNIRPKYQRAYIADLTKNWRENLINSIICGFPINRIYLGVDINDPKGISGFLEVLDGQQRIKTICDFVNGDFEIMINGDKHHFENLTIEKREKLLNYPLDITYCIGDEDARIAWFRRINQPNAILVPQEIRNAIYRGEWLEDAKKYFSATTSHSKNKLKNKDYKYCTLKYSKNRCIERAEYLELALDWKSYYDYPELRGKEHEDNRICCYMAKHQKDADANELINHYKKVIDWVNDIFLHNYKPKTWQSIQSQDWGKLFTEYSNKEFTEEEKIHITERCKQLVSFVPTRTFYDSKGIYEWVIRGENENEIHDYLCLRSFTPDDKAEMYSKQGGIDPLDNKHYELSEMHAHHIKAFADGGNSEPDNLVLLSKENHRNFHLNKFGISNKQLKEMRDELIAKVKKFGN
jgi:hypothetical protein